MEKKIKINGYRRRDGTWVTPHYRTIKIKFKMVKVKLDKTVYDNLPLISDVRCWVVLKQPLITPRLNLVSTICVYFI